MIIMLTEDYDLLDLVGQGKYGKVWRAEHKSTNKLFAIKQVEVCGHNEEEQHASLVREAELMSRLSHPNIVTCYGYFDRPDSTICIVMQFCDGGDLHSRLQQQQGELIEENQIMNWFIQICMAIQYLHGQNILHRDLKTQNIFLTKKKFVKLGDFGIARSLKSDCDMAETFIGTPYYMSPELFASKPYNSKTDMWSLGCCLHEMMTLKYAFTASTLPALMKIIMKGQIPDLPKKYSKELIALCKQLLSPKSSHRPCVNAVIKIPIVYKHIRCFLQENRNGATESLNSAGAVSVVTTESPTSTRESLTPNHCQESDGSADLTNGSPVSKCARKKKQFLKEKTSSRKVEILSGDPLTALTHKPAKKKSKSKQPVKHRPLPIPPISGQGEPTHRKEVRRVQTKGSNLEELSDSSSTKTIKSSSGSSLEEMKPTEEAMTLSLRSSTNFNARRKRREKNSSALSSSVEIIRLQGTLTSRISPPQTIQPQHCEGSQSQECVTADPVHTAIQEKHNKQNLSENNDDTSDDIKTMMTLFNDTLITRHQEYSPLSTLSSEEDQFVSIGDPAHTNPDNRWIGEEQPDIHRSKTERYKALKDDCSEGIDPTLFHLACEIIESETEDRMEVQLIHVLGREKYEEYALKIWQLKFMKKTMDSIT